jgi:hypothetical protein
LIRIEYSIPAKGFKVHIHHNVFKDYAAFDGQLLIQPRNPLSVPSKIAIDEHNKQFKELWTVI